MATIRTAIELQDNFTGVLNSIVSAVNMSISAMDDLNRSMSGPVGTASLDAAREAADQATIAVRELDAAMQDAGPPAAEATATEAPAPAPASWQSDSLPAFTNTGVERFQQEVQSTNNMLNALNGTQRRIAETAAQTDLFPASAVSDMDGMRNRLTAIGQRIQAIGSNPLNIGSDEANAELEQLRGQLNQATQEQEELNRAVENMDVEAANQAYLRLSQTVGNTERYIRDNTDEQGNFNRAISEGTEQSNGLTNVLRGAVAALATVQTARKALDMSDRLTSTTARLNLMNDGLQTTQDLQDMIFLSAERARGSYQQTADAVSKLGLMAGDAFSSSEEIIAFTEQLNKQFTIAGTEASGIDAAMLQLTQAMGSGVLRGEEYNSILEQAPNIIQAIADYMDVPKGKLKEMAAEGKITAGIVKNAMFAAASETNAKFEQMPQTFSQIWTSFGNTATMAFQPVLQRLNEIANSEAFQSFVNNAIQVLSAVAGVALGILDLIVQIGSAVADNWSWIAPIISGIATAMGLYYGWLLLTKAAEAVSAGVKIAVAVASYAHAAATGAEASATAVATAAQYGLNKAMLASPITWIIALIVALIAAVIAVAHHIASMSGTATTTFGVICGGVNVVIQFFRNLGLMVANIALGIANAIGALASNIMTAFHNAICAVQSWWYGLLSTVLGVIGDICAALNKLPFVEFDYSGVTGAADNYAAKSAEAAGSKEGYESVGDAFNKGFNTFDAFGSGWASDAYSAGASWGDNVSNKVSDKISGIFGGSSIPDKGKYQDLSGYGSGASDLGGIGSGVDDIAGNTGAIADSMDVTEEDLKYLRDIAEQEAVNRFTTAEIKINQTNNNNISSKMDLDGVISGLTDAVGEAVDSMAEGVHY